MITTPITRELDVIAVAAIDARFFRDPGLAAGMER